ncbi:class I SAM-dependent methyltransferase [Aurantivibrio infirmus]
MPTISIDNHKLGKRKSRPILNGVARSAVHKVLQHLRFGKLIIEENGEVFTFGETTENFDLVANIYVHDSVAYRDVLLEGTVGAGESYMLNQWSSPDLLKVIRIFVANMAVIERMDGNTSWFSKLSSSVIHHLNINTKRGSKRNISAHYDLGNDFFDLILDKKMMYSAAIYPDKDSDLETAANNKLEKICQKLQLKPTDHLLEIGTGWGGMAIYAAKNYGCKVTTTTISQQQFDYAKAWVEKEGLQDRIELLLEDYRDLTGTYDKLVSIEMIEAVGHKFYKSYFSQCSSLLKDDGLMVIQAITIADQRFQQAKSAVDFIQKYIFPGGCLPSNEVIAKQVSNATDMQIVGLEDITSHYARTLKDWRRRFFSNLDEVKRQGFNSRFIRMWEFYLCYCEGGFAERVISTAQIVFAKPRARLG